MTERASWFVANGCMCHS